MADFRTTQASRRFPLWFVVVACVLLPVGPIHAQDADGCPAGTAWRDCRSDCVEQCPGGQQWSDKACACKVLVDSVKTGGKATPEATKSDPSPGSTCGVRPLAEAVCSSGSRGDIGLCWVAIPGGSFRMGSESGFDDEKHLHDVVVGAFSLTRTEITVAQYKACVDARACTPPATGGFCNWGVAGREDHPANCVSWDDATSFAGWVGARLPSEAEWEYAARSGGKACTYPWGNALANCERAVMEDGSGNGCGEESTWPVCSKKPGNTAQGLCDMAGNVWEWVQDWYHPTYQGAPADASAWVVQDSSMPYRVLRGGSWGLVGGLVRAANRDWNGPSGRGGDFGFRLAR